MAHFAQLDSNNIVERIIVITNDDSGGGDLDTEASGIAFCKNHCGDSSSVWKQTSYNDNFRGNFAGVGHTYMTGVRTLGVASTDIFIDQQPFPSWSIGINTATWYSPIGEMPIRTQSEIEANKRYYWDEAAYQVDNNVGWALTTYPDL